MNDISKVEKKQLSINSNSYGFIGSEKVLLYSLSNGNVNINVTNFGGIITRISTPDRQGNQENIVAGFDSLDKYLDDQLYLECIVGRHANRINNGRFTIDGIPYQ